MLTGAVCAIFITGTQDAWAMVVFFCSAGLGALVAKPLARPSWVPVALAVLFCLAASLTLLPLAWFSPPAWRTQFPENHLVALGSFLAAVPAFVWFWWRVLAGSCLAGLVLLTSPLEGRRFAWFLHLVAAVVAIYAILSIVDAQTAWTYPFSGGAPFGFLPNRNHTATFLAVGAIISFGLMQWELSHGQRVAAMLAALCGAPPLAALLFFSISRAGVLILAFGFVVWLLGMPATAAKRFKMLAAAALLGLFLLVLFLVGGSAVQERLEKLWQDVIATEAGAQEGVVIDYRQVIFRDTTTMIADSPFAGVGLGHFLPVFPHYRETSARADQVLHPESDWLFVAAETGLPSVAILLCLVAWFFTRCWHARDLPDGLLRWTVASAIGAALAHGIVDVPWHRPAMGWFLLVVALASVPSSGLAPRWPWLWRVGQLAVGLALIWGAIHLARQNATDRPPLAYRWPAYNAEMTKLSKEKRFEEGEVVATAAVKDFPLNYQAYYWYAGFLRTFLDTEGEMEAALNTGRFVDPVLPRVTAEQAMVWATIDPALEAGARADSARRAARIDRTEGKHELPSAGEQVRLGLEAASERPEVQRLILEELGGDPILVAYWLRSATDEPAQAMLLQIPDLAVFLANVPEGLRSGVLKRLVNLPEPSSAVDYMESQTSANGRPYWRLLAKHYAKAGDKPRAVATVAKAAGVSLEGGGRGINDFGRQLATLEGQGNDVSVRRLLAEALAAKKPDADQLAVVMVWSAAAGDWDNAWRAASRLASEIKIGD
jgi:O-antigen ligase